ncbi:MAG: hypothetical protein NZ951_04630 [Dehalococcoidia bacterium]|nr:hypothetical protein [Dehalococcoidia bacterium]MDW8120331.1 hypothetical protein [Chloroflexota bacterium]
MTQVQGILDSHAPVLIDLANRVDAILIDLAAGVLDETAFRQASAEMV